MVILPIEGSYLYDVHVEERLCRHLTDCLEYASVTPVSWQLKSTYLTIYLPTNF